MGTHLKLTSWWKRIIKEIPEGTSLIIQCITYSIENGKFYEKRYKIIVVFIVFPNFILFYRIGNNEDADAWNEILKFDVRNKSDNLQWQVFQWIFNDNSEIKLGMNTYINAMIDYNHFLEITVKNI